MLFGKKKKETVEPVEETRSMDELNNDYEEAFADVDSSDVSSWTEDEYNRISKIKDSFERGLISEDEIPEADQQKIMKLYDIEINELQGDIKDLQEENAMYEKKLNDLGETKQVIDSLGISENLSIDENIANIKGNEEGLKALKETMDKLAKENPELLKEMVKQASETNSEAAKGILDAYKKMYPEIFNEE